MEVETHLKSHPKAVKLRLYVVKINQASNDLPSTCAIDGRLIDFRLTGDGNFEHLYRPESDFTVQFHSACASATGRRK